MTEQTEPRILSGKYLDRKNEAWKTFGDGAEYPHEGTCVDAQLRSRPLILPYATVAKKLNAVLRLTISEEQYAYTTLKPENARPGFVMEIWDISTKGNAIIAWSEREGYWASETISCSPEQVAWLKRRWETERQFNEALAEELDRAQLNGWSITMRRQRVLEDAGLDDTSIMKKRREAFREAHVDDNSITTAKEEVRARVRLQFPETD